MNKSRWVIALVAAILSGSVTQAQDIPSYTVSTVYEGTSDANVSGQVAVDPSGNIIFVDVTGIKIHKISAVDGTVSTFAGGGSTYNLILAHIPTFAPPETFPATEANLGSVTNVTVDPSGNVYTGAATVWKITPDGTMSNWQAVV